MSKRYVVGDKVKIVKYGSAIWVKKDTQPKMELPIISEDEDKIWYDLHPEILGSIGVIDKVNEIQGIVRYSIKGIGSWYNGSQMEMINPNPNRD